MSNGYGISSSPDLVHWSILDSVSLPADARHGSVVRLTAAEAATTLQILGEEELSARW